jgi:hypothetical protein
MAQIYGQLIVPGESNRWVPLSVIEVGGQFILKTQDVSDSGSVNHYNGLAGASPVEVIFSSETKNLVVKNASPTETLSVSFDGGTNYIDISPLEKLELKANQTSVDVFGTGSGAAYQILTIE